jgi:hypothetical protein
MSPERIRRLTGSHTFSSYLFHSAELPFVMFGHEFSRRNCFVGRVAGDIPV